MKRRFYFTVAVIAILAAVPFVGSAKLPISTIHGVVLGVDAPNISVIETATEMPTKDQFGYHVGIMFGLDLPVVDIIPELIFVKNKMEFNTTSAFQGEKFISNSIEVPVLASVDLLGFLNLKAGPSFSIFNEAKMKMKDGDKVSLGRVKSSTGYVIGVGATLSKIMVDVRYNGQFNSTETMWGTANTPASLEVKTSSFSATLGFRF